MKNLDKILTLIITLGVVILLVFLIFGIFVIQDRTEISKNDDLKVSDSLNSIKTKIVTNKTIPRWKIGEDTILEKNSPNNLDLTKHQLFIDTTRNSLFFNQNKKLIPSDFSKGYIKEILSSINKIKSIEKISLKNFPKKWIQLRKLNNRYVVYHPCNGRITNFELTSTSFILNYQIEPDADYIDKLISISSDKIELGLLTHHKKSKNQKATLQIKKTHNKSVYIMSYNIGDWNRQYFVTPLENLKNFDMVINHCPQTLRSEYQFGKY